MPTETGGAMGMVFSVQRRRLFPNHWEHCFTDSVKLIENGVIVSADGDNYDLDTGVSGTYRIAPADLARIHEAEKLKGMTNAGSL